MRKIFANNKQQETKNDWLQKASMDIIESSNCLFKDVTIQKDLKTEDTFTFLGRSTENKVILFNSKDVLLLKKNGSSDVVIERLDKKGISNYNIECYQSDDEFMLSINFLYYNSVEYNMTLFT